MFGKPATTSIVARGRLAKDHAERTHLTDYGACQALADTARAAKVEIIRYRSVRDPSPAPDYGHNLALLTSRAFTRPRPIAQQTWLVRLSAAGAQAVCEQPKSGITFDRVTFELDSRIGKLRWQSGP